MTIAPSSSVDPALETLRDGFVQCGIPELLRYAAPHCPEGLIDSKGWSRLDTLPPELPPVNSIGAFECRLESGATRVDFEVCIRSAGGGRRKLGASLAQFERVVPAGAAGWCRTLSFLREWTDPTSLLFDAFPVVWLEFDLETPSPVPFVVATLNRELTSQGRPVPILMRAMERALGLLGGTEMDVNTMACLVRCLDFLPLGGRLLHLALRPVAKTQFLRVILKVPVENLPGYLSRIGWPGSPTDLGARLRVLSRATPLPSVNLDLVPEVGPRVGIEYTFEGAPASDPRWRNVFDELERVAACTSERRAQLEKWPSAADPMSSSKLFRIDRELLIKAIYETNGPLRAKAYLPFSARLNL